MLQMGAPCKIENQRKTDKRRRVEVLGRLGGGEARPAGCELITVPDDLGEITHHPPPPPRPVVREVGVDGAEAT